MNCPKCGGQTLSRLEVQGIEVDTCGACAGVWLDEYELEDLLELQPEELQALLGGDGAPEDADAADAACPRDGAKLRRMRQRGVVIDGCPDCQGLWLDGGEFKRLRGL
jgi:Zn-finger nucleic acid-binding protein